MAVDFQNPPLTHTMGRRFEFDLNTPSQLWPHDLTRPTAYKTCHATALPQPHTQPTIPYSDFPSDMYTHSFIHLVSITIIWLFVSPANFNPAKCVCITVQYFTVPHLFLQESGHSSGIPVESTGILRNSSGILQESSHSSGILLEFHWNSTGIRMESSRLRLKYSFIQVSFSSCADMYTFLFPCHFYTMFTPVLYP